MAVKTETKTSTPSFAADLPSAEEATQQIRDLNERLLASSKSAGVVALDAYEKVVQSLVDFELKVASATQVDWVSTLAATHTKAVSDLSSPYTKAARELLN